MNDSAPVKLSPLYEQVADKIARLIQLGTLCAGDRIPSVRQLRSQLGISVTTVLEAYRLLESKGLVEARPQSGYGELYFGEHRPKPAKIFDTEGMVLLCSSFSKDLAPGYRVGWTVPGRFKPQVERLKHSSTIANATLPQLAIAEFLQNGGYDHHLRQLRKAYAAQVQRVTQAISQLFPRGTKVTRPTGGFLLWVELPKSVDSLQLYRQALQHKISIVPGSIFSTTQQYQHCIRLNCGTWSAEIEQALAILGYLAGQLN